MEKQIELNKIFYSNKKNIYTPKILKKIYCLQFLIYFQ